MSMGMAEMKKRYGDNSNPAMKNYCSVIKQE
jgi:hypothetical protein